MPHWKWIVTFFLVLLLAGSLQPAFSLARPVGAETIQLVIQTDRFRGPAEHAVTIWNGGQNRYKVQLNDRCFSGTHCIYVRDTWYAGPWFRLNCSNYGTEVYTQEDGSGVILLPNVLSSKGLLYQFDQAFHQIPQSTQGVPVDSYVIGSLVAYEMGNYMGLPNRPGDTIMNDHGWPNGQFAQDGSDAEAVWQLP